jgi:uncharacterized protein YqhQ
MGQVGGSALPGGVMMRTNRRVGVAVRHEDTGEIVTEGFDEKLPTGRWTRWPLMRGVVAMRVALSTGQKAMSLSERLRWEPRPMPGEAPEPAAAGGAAAGEAPAEGGGGGMLVKEDGALGPLGKVLVVLGALLGAGVQIAAFRIGPIVIAKEAGLEGAAFIVADAALRLALLLITLRLVALIPPFRRILAYHGAEHQAIAAHEAGHRISAAAAAGFSRFHPRCGTSFLVVSGVVSIAVYGGVLAATGVFTYPALIATRLIGGPIVTAIAYELQRQAALRAHGKWRFLSWPGLAAQRVTTAKPEHAELEVACAALAVALEQPVPVTEPATVEVRESAPMAHVAAPAHSASTS